MHGPPGCGKTSLIMALAGEIKYNLCVLSLNDTKMSDEQLVQLMGEVPAKSFVLLEDIDAMFGNRQGKTVVGLYVTYTYLPLKRTGLTGEMTEVKRIMSVGTYVRVRDKYIGLHFISVGGQVYLKMPLYNCISKFLYNMYVVPM